MPPADGKGGTESWAGRGGLFGFADGARIEKSSRRLDSKTESGLKISSVI